VTDPAQPVPGPTREQIAEAIDSALNGDVAYRRRHWHRTPSDDVNAAADAVEALLPGADHMEEMWEHAQRADAAEAEVERLRARPCPWVETSDEGTSHCRLAAGTGDEDRIARENRRRQ
jgi:hypothetical protein